MARALSPVMARPRHEPARPGHLNRLLLKGESRCYDRVMARLDRAIALFIALLPMVRSSRTMTLQCLTFQRFSILALCREECPGPAVP
jgi:hypothetical protein